MNKFPNSLRAVLWGAIGLGGGGADADTRIVEASLALILMLAVALVLGLIGGLIAAAHVPAT